MNRGAESDKDYLSEGPSSLECWDYSVELECLRGPQDLQLAAELGKTLLERNKELETSLKQHQNVVEEQTQEIEYLTKQTAALREVNDSRLRIYEQLEVSIQELEHTNQKLSVDNISDKKLIKTLTAQIETLDQRCEELQKNLDGMAVAQESARRKQRRSVSTPDNPTPPVFTPVDEDEVLQLLQQVQQLRSQRARDQRRATDMEEQLTQLIQENACLEERMVVLRQKEEEMQSLQEELTTLEEIRQGHLCRKCMRHKDAGLITADEEDDDVSIIDSLVDESQRTSVLMQLQESLGESCQGDNPYRDLVEKYEALLKVQRHPGIIRPPQTVSSNNCLSLQEELQLSGDFFQKEEVDSDGEIRELPKKDSVKTIPNGKALSATPTEFSEAETSSSGFSDETSNKGTQTDAHFPPGSFLCTITDGDDCRFSIYDDASPVESRFRKTPEYRQLFREIFAVLKRAAEAKDEGEKLPLLDDFTPFHADNPKVSPITPAKEDFPSHIPDPEEEMSQFTEDQSIVSLEPSESSNSFVNDSAPICGSTPKTTGPALICDVNTNSESHVHNDQSNSSTEGKKPTNDILEYLGSGVGHKKKSKKKTSFSPERTLLYGLSSRHVYRLMDTMKKEEVKMSSVSDTHTSDRPNRCLYSQKPTKRESEPKNKTSSSPKLKEIFGITSKRVYSLLDTEKKEVKLDYSVSETQTTDRLCEFTYVNNAHKTWRSPEQADTQRPSSSWDSHFTKAATQVATLKMLDKSYAEVLRQSSKKKNTGTITHCNWN